MDKSGPTMWAISENKKNLPKVNNHPFAQSGHSGSPIRLARYEITREKLSLQHFEQLHFFRGLKKCCFVSRKFLLQAPYVQSNDGCNLLHIKI
jgi:hypothetical protein